MRETIRNFAAYPQWIDQVKVCEEYAAENGHIYVRFVLGTAGMKVEYFIDHVYTPGSEWMTWTLDYRRKSELDDSVGMWRVVPIPGQPGAARVEYSVDVAVTTWVPGFVREFLVNQGLKDATSWVKAQAEAKPSP